MTTFYPVQPSISGAPQFTPTLDGNPYSVSVIWSLNGQRYYVNCSDLSGNLIFSRPLIETLPGLQIDALSYDELSGFSFVTTDQPHGYAIGSTISLTISGAVPDAYNGTSVMLATAPGTLSFPLSAAANPGPAMIGGALNYLISICAGYFQSTMVYRNGQFEISP